MLRREKVSQNWKCSSYSSTGPQLDKAVLRQIAGGALEKATDESLKESVEWDGRRKALEKEIAALENKICKEKQFNRQVEMNGRLKMLRKELNAQND